MTALARLKLKQLRGLRRWDVINMLLAKRPRPTSYLEIGVWTGTCGRLVNTDRKVGVDIKVMDTHHVRRKYHSIYQGTSDDYFAESTERFDLVFIDGLHTAEQSAKDFENAQNSLKEGGFIVLHDTNPPTYEYSNRLDRTGDVWRTAVAIMGHPELNGSTVDIETGVTVVEPGTNPQPFTHAVPDYQTLERMRGRALRLVTAENWTKLHGPLKTLTY